MISTRWRSLNQRLRLRLAQSLHFPPPEVPRDTPRGVQAGVSGRNGLRVRARRRLLLRRAVRSLAPPGLVLPVFSRTCRVSTRRGGAAGEEKCVKWRKVE